MTEPTPNSPPNPAGPPPTEWNPPASQADLDRMISDRITRERAKYADYSDLKAKASKLDEIEAANASDLEKAVKAAKDEGRTEAQQTANGRIVASEARALAAAAKFRDPGDAVRFLDLTAIKVADDGTVDQAGIRTLLDDLAKTKDYLIVADDTPKPPRSFGGGPRQTHDTNSDDPRARDIAQIDADIKAGARAHG